MVRNSAGDRGSLLIRGMESPLSSHLTYRWHPRSCGVYAAVLRALSWAVGSSPLARGLPAARLNTTIATRIIPARAGFTSGSESCSWRPPDHPRSRGVYREAEERMARKAGSSPLARGLHHAAHARPRGRRIIPARAGFTGSRTAPCAREWDHPRSRGAYIPDEQIGADRAGSSPLARGLPRNRARRPPGGRIIPARAGFTSPMNKSVQTAQDHPRSRGVYFS